MTARIVSDELVELDRPFAEFFRTLTSPWPFRPLLALAPDKHFIPTADVFARKGDFVVRMDLPGMDPKDIHVKFVAEELTVTGERKFDKEVKEEGYYRKESSYGTFERHISLPKAVKESDIKATYDSGGARDQRPTGGRHQRQAAGDDHPGQSCHPGQSRHARQGLSATPTGGRAGVSPALSLRLAAETTPADRGGVDGDPVVVLSGRTRDNGAGPQSG